jgi:signal transduction histidine kinase
LRGFAVLIGLLFSQSLTAQNCNRLFESYDSLSDLNQLSDNQRKVELFKILKVCKEDETGIWQRFAQIYQKHKQYDSTFYYYTIALNSVSLKNQTSYWNSIAMNIGNVYAELEYYDKALSYYLRDTQIRFRNLSKSDLSDYYYNRASIYSCLKQFEKADADLAKALAYYTGSSLNSRVSFVILKAEILKEEHSFTEAFKIIRKEFKHRNDNLQEEYRIALYNLYSYLLCKVSKNPSSKIIADTALNLAKRLGNETILYTVMSDVSEVYAMLNDSGGAFKLILEAKSINDRLLNARLKEAVTNGEFTVHQQLNYKNLKIAESELRIKSIWIWTLATGVGVLVILVFLGVSYYKQRQRLKNQEIEIQENKIKQILQEQDLGFLNENLKGQIDERKRIATDLHNSLGNRLASIKLGFENISKKTHLKPQQQERIAIFTELIDETCTKLREIAHNQYLQGWIFELNKRLIQIEKTHHIKTNLIDNGIDLTTFPILEREIYTISEGLLKNTIQYANATEINIQLMITDNILKYSYEDNGVGFILTKLKTGDGLGFKTLNERVKLFNGEWYLDTSPQHGVTVLINIPIDENNNYNSR